MMNRWKPCLMATTTLCLVACTNRERPVGIADLQGQIALELNGSGSHAGSSLSFFLHLATGDAFDVNHCPVLHNDVQVTVNGIATKLYSRGGSTANPILPPVELIYSCDDIAGTLDLPDAPPLLEVRFADRDGAISSQVEAFFDPPTLALAADQPSQVRPGDTVRLRYTPANSIIEGGTKPLLIGTAEQFARLAANLAETIPSLPFTAADGDLRFTVPKLPAGAVQVVLENPRIDANTLSCVGAVSCPNGCVWGGATATVPLTILGM
jgi:hypothetical protein